MTSGRQGSVLFLEKERRVRNILFVGSAHSYTEHAPFFAAVAQITRSKTSRASIIDLSGGNAADGSATES